MDKGKYRMTHIRTLAGGQKDTFELNVYGPNLYDGSYYFWPGVENDGVGRVEVYKIAKKSKTKSYQKIKVYLNQTLIPYDGYFFGKITAYEVKKRSLVLDYTSYNNAFSGNIQIEWIDL